MSLVLLLPCPEDPNEGDGERALRDWQDWVQYLEDYEKAEEEDYEEQVESHIEFMDWAECRAAYGFKDEVIPDIVCIAISCSRGLDGQIYG